jgi:hypothetical protein
MRILGTKHGHWAFDRHSLRQNYLDYQGKNRGDWI